MAEIVRNTNHAQNSIARLIDWARGKPNIEAMLHCKSAYRIDIRAFELAQLYQIVLNNCIVSYNSIIGDDEVSVAQALVDKINNGNATKAYEHFEDFLSGAIFQGAGQLGSWIIEAELLPDSGVASGYTIDSENGIGESAQSIRPDFLSIPIPPKVPDTGPQFLRNATLENYAGSGDATQQTTMYAKFPTGWPGPEAGPTFTFRMPIAVLFYDTAIDPAMLFVILNSDTFGEGSMQSPHYYAHAIILGLPGIVTLGPIPESYLFDDSWHKYHFRFEADGSSITMEIDDGAYTITGAGLTAVAATNFALFSGGQQSSETEPLFGVLEFYIDNLSVGSPLSCDTIEQIKAHKENIDDDFFYVAPRETAGMIINGAPENPALISMHRIGTVDQLQEAENMFLDLTEQRSFSTGEGEQLDKLGTILGLRRQPGQNDADYSALLNVQITKNLSNGEAWRLIQIAGALTDGTVKYSEHYPGRITINLDGTIANEELLATLLDKIAGGGIRLTAIKRPTPVFKYDQPPGSGHGYDIGKYSDVIG